VFRELVEADRMTLPIEQVGAWLFQVARNRITDLLRRRRTRDAGALPVRASAGDDNDVEESVQAWLPDEHGGPDAMYARRLLLEELDAALDELPEDQRRVFVAHELEGCSFKELSQRWGVGVNTLLSRKRYAVLHLRQRLQAIYDDFLET
jgi:RNA polymerase sigma factor (sigma-70 family)